MTKFITVRRVQLLIAGGIILAVSLMAFDTYAQGKSKPKRVDVASVYTQNCARCHGADGAGTGLGRTMEVPDLSDAGFQKRLSTAKIRQAIVNGKGSMPAFKSKLSGAEVSALTPFVRGLKK